MGQPGEKIERSAAKAFSWRVFASLTTVIISYLATGRFEIAATIGVADVVCKLILYFLHERAWDAVRWGRLKHEGTPPSQTL